MTDSLPLIGANDPPAFRVLNAEATKPLLLICDHASRAFPKAMNSLGLSKEDTQRHIAYDIGAADVTQLLAEKMDVPAIFAGYSRLLIDCNRAPGEPMSIAQVSDGVPIPGNQNLNKDELTLREETFFEPYHNAVTNALAHLWRLDKPPVLFSIHSFTPSMDGEERQWDVGVLWNHDPRLALPLIDKLRDHGGVRVGDNEPYSGREIAYSLNLHGAAAGLANCGVEIRQDHLETEEGRTCWAKILCDAFDHILTLDHIHRVEHY